jgi:hypothetical protein
MMHRRTLLRSLGLSGLGVASLATGLPLAFLRQPLAFAAGDDTVDPDRAQFLILSGRDKGDPFNANAPGTYVGAVVHAEDPSMAPTSITLGEVATTAAQVWSTLPQWVLDRSAFIHHATRTQVHGHLVKVLQLLGDTYRDETIASIFAKHLAPALGTIGTAPVPVGDVNLTYEGRALPRLLPQTLRELMLADESPLFDLQAVRDDTVDELHAILRTHGSASQRRFLDDHTKARNDVRALGESAADVLSLIAGNRTEDELHAAVAIVKLGLSPVVALEIPFGGDNHNDPGLALEIEQHGTGMAQLGLLMDLLQSQGLADRVTFASLNVFGRSLGGAALDGRTHHAPHHVTMLVGAHVRPAVIGGLAPDGDDFTARAFDAATGVPSEGGDVSYDDGLPSVGKTIGALLGLPDAVLDEEILTGKVIGAAIMP